MNTAMYENPVTQDNIELLKHYGMEVITPSTGHLACGDNGTGKMPEPETLFQYICKSVGYKKDMTGMKVLVTAGPTQEAIDPVVILRTILPERWDTALQKPACSAAQMLPL